MTRDPNNDEEDMSKAEVKLETESGDESLDCDNSKDYGEESSSLTKSEVKEEKEKG